MSESPERTPDGPVGSPEGSQSWKGSVLLVVIGALIGTAALTLFCYALGLNLTDQGWPKDFVLDNPRRLALFASLIAAAVAILVFWIGFFRFTHPKD